MTEFGMNVQEAAEAPNINTYQFYLSLGDQNRKPRPGVILLNSKTPEWTQKELKQMGYTLRFSDRTSGPITAIYLDAKHGSFWGGASNFEDDYGIGW
jgi:gamma-glutamyltranspeptidase/glutathione hydrolase